MGNEPAAPLAVSIRRLTAAEAGIYRPLRLEALRLHPEAFGADYADEAKMSLQDVAARLPSPPSGLFGGFVRNDSGDALASMVGLLVPSGAKLRHNGRVVSMYVAPPYRRRGLAAALLRHVIGDARAAGLRALQLGVTVGNAPARQFYLRFGFRPYGTQPEAIRVDGQFFDEELMALRLY